MPTEAELTSVFSRLLGTIAAADSVSTRPEQRLNQIANLLIVKLESDKVGFAHKDRPLHFQLRADEADTLEKVNALYGECRRTRVELFSAEDPDEIALSAQSVQRAVLELQSLNLKEVSHRALSCAFQVFRAANLKVGDGQYFTPTRVVSAGVRMMDITDEDKVIDPACVSATVKPTILASVL